jgi:myo-inositol 2-dehydrogenase/D-chiro-inositol 1-dehydrogenase
MAPSSSSPDRRRFLTAAAAAAGVTFIAPSAVRGAPANARIELGLIGCGGRGSWIANLFHENGRGRIVALHDYFQDRVDALGDRLKIDRKRRFTGLDGYRQLLAGRIDGVVIESPPYFHPEQTVAALQAGKHVYLAKPISVDVPGAQAIAAAADRGRGKLCCWVDFQARVDEYYQGAAQRLFKGLIGRPFLAQASYLTGRLGRQARPGTEMARLRNWVFDKALSGDIIVEQNIHALDVANWFLRGHPVKAAGTGGRRVRTDVGDCWDHFACTFWYPGDVIVSFCSKQAGAGIEDICVKVFCETGTLESHYGGPTNIRGQSGNNYAGGSSPGIYRAGAVRNIQLFLEAVAAGRPISNARESADSTITCVLGRTAAYRQTTVTWAELLKANERLDANLKLPADGPRWRPS